MGALEPDGPGAELPADHGGQDTVAWFAGELRRLRAEAGSPSFRHMARIAHYSASTLAEATAGRRLPTEAVVKAFVLACGAEPAEWLSRLAQVAHKEDPPSGDSTSPRDLPTQALAASGGEGADSSRPPGPRRQGRLRPAQGWWMLALAVVAVIAVLVGRATAPGSAPSVLPTARAAAVTTAIPVAEPSEDGADPHLSGCYQDARLVDKSPLMATGIQVGALELLFSARCDAGWARVYLYPGQPTMLGFVQVRASDGRLSSFADLLIKQVPTYTDVIVAAKGGCLGATATVYAVGRTPSDALIPCQAMNAR
jgi:hypothetical protein